MNTRSPNGHAHALWALVLLFGCGSTPETDVGDTGQVQGGGTSGQASSGGSGGGGSGGYDSSGGNGGRDGGGNSDGSHAGDDGVQPEGSPVTLPMVVDSYYIVSGYAGDGQGGKVAETACPLRAGERRGKCHAFTWAATDKGWASIFWQWPANNWGLHDLPGRPIPGGAKQVSFYAWGKQGGEAISFGAGLDGKDSFTIMAPPITLTTTPKQYTLSLDGVDYGSRVISSFMWSANQGSEGAEVTFYVDDIIWSAESAVGPSPEWPAGPVAQGVSVRVRNLCAFPLWIGGSGKQANLAPDRARLATGEIGNYDLPKIWEAARVNAYQNETDPEPLEKAELTFYQIAGGEHHVSYNVTYVDWLGLPLEITSLGGACNAASHTTGCFARESEVLSGCPEAALRLGDRCLSPRTYCLNGHQHEALCTTLDRAIADCPTCPKGSTTNVFACDGPYAQEPRMCAALNRGMTAAPDDANEGAYYQAPPYNTYAKWVHQVCPGIYAFSYDDWLSHGGYRSCSGGTEVRITFCPRG